MRRISAKLGLCATVLLLVPTTVRAECAALTLPQLLNGPFSASLVFKGTVKNLDRTNELFQAVTFSVKEIWKGNLDREITLGQMNTAESVPFAEGAEYLVFAFDPSRSTIRPPFPPDMLGINCCATTVLEVAKRRGLLRGLGRGRTPKGR